MRYEFNIRAHSEGRSNEIYQALKNIDGIICTGSNASPSNKELFYEEFVEAFDDFNKPVIGGKFSVGDVVKLKSGGPAMTACGFIDEQIAVVWYIDEKQEYAYDTLGLEVLVKIET